MWYCDPTSSASQAARATAISSKVQCHDTVTPGRTDITASTDSQLAKVIELDDRRPGCRRSPVRTLSYRRLCLHDGGTLVVWRPNSRDIKATANSAAGVNRDTVACPSVAVSPTESSRSDMGRLVSVVPCRSRFKLPANIHLNLSYHEFLRFYKTLKPSNVDWFEIGGIFFCPRNRSTCQRV